VKIVLVVGSFLPEKSGGTELYVFNLAKAFSALKCEVSVLTLSDSKNCSYEYDGIKVDVIQSSELSLTVFIEFIKFIGPTVVHFHSFDSNFNINHLKQVSGLGILTYFTPHLANNLCMRNGELRQYGRFNCNGQVGLIKCQLCISDHIRYYKVKTLLGVFFYFLKAKYNYTKSESHWSQSHQKKKMLRGLQNHANRVIVVSDWMLNSLQVNGLSNVNYVKSGVQKKIDLWNNSAIENEIITIVYAGRVSREKGIDILCEAVASLNTSLVKLKLLLIPSDGEFLKEIISLVSGVNVEIKFNLSQKEVQEELRNSAVLCLPSRVREMAPLIILEAFNLGLPVITSSICQNSVRNGIDGLIFENGNFEDLAKKILFIQQDPSRVLEMRKNFIPSRDYNDIAIDLLNYYKID
jgi:glycosyltransferase involved in cell wall biosynthesis